MEIFSEAGLLTTTKRPTVAAADRRVVDAIGTDLFGMHAAAGTSQHSAARKVSWLLSRDGDLTVEHEEPGVEVVQWLDSFMFQPQAGVTRAEAVAPQAAANSC